MKILYVTYTDLDNVSSGSGVRPACMYRAFQERGHEVYLLSGVCGRGHGKQRKAAVAKAVQWLETNQPDLCYIESPTYPIMDKCDYDLIRLLKKKKIPTGYFYRDAYRLFPDLFPKRTGFVNSLKELYLDILQWCTDRVLRNVDVVYYPSRYMFGYFSFKCMKTLPPAGEVSFLPHHKNTKTCVYVGGISERYGLPLMLEAFQLLNRDEVKYKLIMVCRKPEYEKEKARIGQPEWLEVYHASGKELEQYYARADAGIIALFPNAYHKPAVTIKLFQYISYGLPVISTDVAASKELIDTYQLGVTAPYDVQAFADAIRYMLDTPGVLEQYRNSAMKALQESHLWVHRVDQIVSDLTGTPQ